MEIFKSTRSCDIWGSLSSIVEIQGFREVMLCHSKSSSEFSTKRRKALNQRHSITSRKTSILRLHHICCTSVRVRHRNKHQTCRHNLKWNLNVTKIRKWRKYAFASSLCLYIFLLIFSPHLLLITLADAVPFWLKKSIFLGGSTFGGIPVLPPAIGRQ